MRTYSKPMKKRTPFRPSAADARLEERVVLSTAATPLPAPPPINSSILVKSFGHPLTVAQLRADYNVQVKRAGADLQTMVDAAIQQAYANGSISSAQKHADLNATVDGAIDATALRLTSQAALLPNANSSLVPTIQNQLLGSGPTSLTSRLNALVLSGKYDGSAGKLRTMVAKDMKLATRKDVASVNQYFRTTPVKSLAVRSTGQPMALTGSTALKEFIGNQFSGELANTLGSLAQSFPVVASAALFPNGTTTTVDPSLMSAFTSQVNTALSTAAFEIGSGLALFPGFTNITSQIQPMLFSSTSNANSLASSLANLDFGSTGFNTAVANAFNTGFQNVLTAISPFFGMQAQSNVSLPTTGITGPFGSAFSASNFDSGFNNGFVTTTGTTGFTGFGQAPTSFNSNFSTGFNNLVTTVNTTNTPLGTITTVGGVPVESR
jgi:hypothetical protein